MTAWIQLQDRIDLGFPVPDVYNLISAYGRLEDKMARWLFHECCCREMVDRKPRSKVLAGFNDSSNQKVSLKKVKFLVSCTRMSDNLLHEMQIEQYVRTTFVPVHFILSESLPVGVSSPEPLPVEMKNEAQRGRKLLADSASGLALDIENLRKGKRTCKVVQTELI